MKQRSLSAIALFPMALALASCGGEAPDGSTEEAVSGDNQDASPAANSEIELTEMTVTTDDIGPVFTADDLTTVGPDSVEDIAILCQELFAPSAWKTTHLAVVDGVVYSLGSMTNTASDFCARHTIGDCAIGWKDGKIIKTNANAPEFRYTEIIDPETLIFEKWRPEFSDDSRKYFAGKCDVEPFTGQITTDR